MGFFQLTGFLISLAGLNYTRVGYSVPPVLQVNRIQPIIQFPDKKGIALSVEVNIK